MRLLLHGNGILVFGRATWKRIKSFKVTHLHSADQDARLRNTFRWCDHDMHAHKNTLERFCFGGFKQPKQFCLSRSNFPWLLFWLLANVMKGYGVKKKKCERFSHWLSEVFAHSHQISRTLAKTFTQAPTFWMNILKLNVYRKAKLYIFLLHPQQ